MFAFKGETVLDPFMGSGTTSLAAKNLDRNSIGYEINPDFIENYYLGVPPSNQAFRCNLIFVSYKKISTSTLNVA